MAHNHLLVSAGLLLPATLIAGCSSSQTSRAVLKNGFSPLTGTPLEQEALAFPAPAPVESVQTALASAPIAAPSGSGQPPAPVAGLGQSSAPDLLEMLVQNGALTPDQVEVLLADQRAPEAQDDPSSWSIGSGGLKFASADGDWQMRIGGRIQVDANVHSREGATPEEQIQDGTELRRGRFELRGSLPEDLSWWAEVEFANNGASVRDFRLQKELTDSLHVSIGHQKQPYSLAVEESSNDLPFIERGVDNFLIIPFVDRALGVRAQGHTDRFFFAGGVFGEGISPTAVDDEGFGFAGRAVHAPIIEDERVLHMGVRGMFRRIEDGANSIRIRDETTNMSNFRVVDTGTLTDVDSVSAFGAELAYVEGPYTIGGEINRLEVEDPGADLGFDSWHVFMTYSLTGETRAKAYRQNQGEFKRLRADNPSGRAWEVSARLASLDLIDDDVDGGAEKVTSLGLNWYWSNNVRYLLNWNRIVETRGGSFETQAAEGADIFTLRAQLTF